MYDICYTWCCYICVYTRFDDQIRRGKIYLEKEIYDRIFRGQRTCVSPLQNILSWIAHTRYAEVSTIVKIVWTHLPIFSSASGVRNADLSLPRRGSPVNHAARNVLTPLSSIVPDYSRSVICNRQPKIRRSGFMLVRLDRMMLMRSPFSLSPVVRGLPHLGEVFLFYRGASLVNRCSP